MTCASKAPRLKWALSGSTDGGFRLWNLENGEAVRDFDLGSILGCVVVVSCRQEGLRQALTGSLDGRVRLLDLEEGRVLRVIDAHVGKDMTALEMDWPSMRAVTATHQKFKLDEPSCAKLWDVERGEFLQTFESDDVILAVAANWQAMELFVGMITLQVILWDMISGTRVRTFSSPRVAIKACPSATTMAINAVEHRALSGLEDGHLVYWLFRPVNEEGVGNKTADADGGGAVPFLYQPPKVVQAHHSPIFSMSVSWAEAGAGFTRAVCGSDDGSLSLWRLDTRMCIQRFMRHLGFVWAVHVDWPQERMISGGYDGCLKLWDLRQGDCIRTIQAHSRPVRTVAVCDVLGP